ncbi:hypothetical protein [Clostridium butyricum]|uniref:hypothetical protein n=1 Tax=Clostridium butyricum TaxID=1492 RepID=UPI0013D12FB3|nr:hypothetical protein [Clostridium butyricum]MCQ2019417.1 hypothetical protein [Clostridium butyricum]MCQ2023632.1 hypothetical protein [Clostridium butyricum]UTY53722.1 hypothetical protein HNS01_11680 [Clostridium butyricum]
MVNLKDVKLSLADALSQEKAYNLPSLCKKYGLDDGEEDEAFKSKRNYIFNVY